VRSALGECGSGCCKDRSILGSHTPLRQQRCSSHACVSSHATVQPILLDRANRGRLNPPCVPLACEALGRSARPQQPPQNRNPVLQTFSDSSPTAESSAISIRIPFCQYTWRYKPTTASSRAQFEAEGSASQQARVHSGWPAASREQHNISPSYSQSLAVIDCHLIKAVD
jgi:hypothetical protein